jgi:hypothetical protein
VINLDWIKRIFVKSAPSSQHNAANYKLVEEIWNAHQDWVIAQQKLNDTIEQDQIDYAIYIIEAMEKRFDMLLREAKAQQLDISEYSPSMLPQQRKNPFDI